MITWQEFLAKKNLNEADVMMTHQPEFTPDAKYGDPKGAYRHYSGAGTFNNPFSYDADALANPRNFNHLKGGDRTEQSPLMQAKQLGGGSHGMPGTMGVGPESMKPGYNPPVLNATGRNPDDKIPNFGLQNSQRAAALDWAARNKQSQKPGHNNIAVKQNQGFMDLSRRMADTHARQWGAEGGPQNMDQHMRWSDGSDLQGDEALMQHDPNAGYGTMAANATASHWKPSSRQHGAPIFGGDQA